MAYTLHSEMDRGEKKWLKECVKYLLRVTDGSQYLYITQCKAMS
jgi:hypothetical protein